MGIERGFMDYEITPEEVVRLRKAGETFTFLDCREAWEYQTAHIEGTKHIPMQDIPTRIQELDPEEHIVVICHRGVRSMNVTSWLRQQGYEKAQSVAGGIDHWARTIDPKVPIY
jgi:rhodanese-related sulfurtransferase